MRRCPKCNSTFVEEHLIYCTADGTVLVRDEDTSGIEVQETEPLSEQPVTMVMPPRPTEYVPQAPNAPTPPAPYAWANDSPPAWAPPPPPVPYVNAARQSQQQGTAVGSLIFGLISITFGWICGGPIFGLLAVVLATVALTQIKRNPQQYGGKPMALAGLIMGGIALLVFAGLMILWLVMVIIGAATN